MLYLNKDQIIELYKKYSALKIAKMLKCSEPTIRKILKNNGIETISKPRLKFYEKEIIKLYIEKKISPNSIAKKFNCSNQTIHRVLIRNNIKKYPLGFFHKGKPSLLKGHTKENDERVKNKAEAQSQKYKKGELKIWCEGLTKETNPKLKKSALKISKTRKRLFAEGKLSHVGEILKKLYKEGKLKPCGVAKFGDENYVKIYGSPCKNKSNPSTTKRLKEQWQNPEYREKFIKRMKSGGGLKARMGNKIFPNKPEKFIIELIQKNNFPFNYVGDGEIWFKGKTQYFNPDFLSKNPKHIIEVFGDYWHNLPNMIEKDSERLKTYNNYGYKTLIIWEHELKNPIQVVNKINNFLKNG